MASPEASGMSTGENVVVLGGKPIDALTEADIRRLVNERVKELRMVECKCLLRLSLVGGEIGH